MSEPNPGYKLPTFGDGDPRTSLYGLGFAQGLLFAAKTMNVAVEFVEEQDDLPKAAYCLLRMYASDVLSALRGLEEKAAGSKLLDANNPTEEDLEELRKRLAGVYGGLGSLERAMLHEGFVEPDVIGEWSPELETLSRAAQVVLHDRKHADRLLFDLAENEDGEMESLCWPAVVDLYGEEED